MSNETNEPSEFAEEYTFRERASLAARGIVVGGLVVLASKLWLLPAFDAFVATAPCRIVLGVSGSTLLWYGLFVGLPLLAFAFLFVAQGRQGLRILRESRFPPAGEKVLRRTRIRRGAAARRIGYLYLFVSTPLIALALWGCIQARTLAHEMQVGGSACVPVTGSDARPSEAGGQAGRRR